MRNDAHPTPTNPEPEWQAALARLVEGESEPGDDALVAGVLRGDRAGMAALREQLELDALLRQEAEPSPEAFVEAVAARVRPPAEEDPFVQRVSRALRPERPRGFWRWPLTLRWAATLGCVATLTAAVFLLLSQAGAGAAALVEQALQAHAIRLDRCYRVEVRGERDGEAPPRRQSLLWTRGDRFWTEIRASGERAAWGRDPAGGVWFALSPQRGARLAADEVPEALRAACDLRSVQLETLLRELLSRYELREEPATETTRLIHALPKPGAAPARHGTVLLEVDTLTHVVRRLELQRAHLGRAVATVTFSLVESRLQDDASYTLEGHLAPDAVVLDDTSARGERGRLIAELIELMRWRPAGLRGGFPAP